MPQDFYPNISENMSEMQGITCVDWLFCASTPDVETDIGLIVLCNQHFTGNGEVNLGGP